jgi:hypothetical protein
MTIRDTNNKIHVGKFENDSVWYQCKEQDDSGQGDPENLYHNRILVITKTCLLLFHPLP